MSETRLFHGTTESSARQIQAEGFRALPEIPSLLSGICDEHEVDVEELTRVLGEMGRWIFVQSERADRIWFATTEAKAFNWAERAPEWRWEALWGIWMIRSGRSESFGSDDYYPWMDPVASSWAFSQIWQDRPAVVVVDICDDELILSGFDEVSVEAPFERILIRDVVLGERRVEFTDAAGLLGISTDDLAGRIHSGAVPWPRSLPEPGRDAWWPLSEFTEWSGLEPGLT